MSTNNGENAGDTEPQANRQKARVLIDCTQTYFWGGNSGIQRVTRNIANQALELQHPRCEVIPVIWVG